MKRIIIEEMAKVDATWWQTHMSTVVTAKAALPTKCFDLTKINSDLVTAKPIMIPPFGCKWVKGMTTITCQTQWVHGVADAIEQAMNNEVVATCTYGELQPGSQQVGMIVLNRSSKEVNLLTKLVIGHVQAANIVPKSMAQQPVEEAQLEAEVVYYQFGHPDNQAETKKPADQLTSGTPDPAAVLSQMDLSGCNEWDPEDQATTKQILREFADVFAKDDLDLGQTSVV